MKRSPKVRFFLSNFWGALHISLGQKDFDFRSSLAQLVEQLTFNQWVTGSSPVRVIFAGLAELADAPDLGSGA